MAVDGSGPDSANGDAIRSACGRLGMIGLGDKSLEQLDTYVKSETVRWAKVIKNANLAGTQ
jgi:hypothetical protein